jgi:hypothetical protein
MYLEGMKETGRDSRIAGLGPGLNGSRVSSVAITMGWTDGVRNPAVARFFLFHNVQTGSGAHPASFPLGTGGPLLGVNRPGREADHSPPSSAEVKNVGARPPLPHMSS